MNDVLDDEQAKASILQKLEKCYLSAVANKALILSLLKNKVIAPLTLDMQEEIMKRTVHHPAIEKCPPFSSYKKFFLRILMDTAESFNSEVSENIVEAYAHVLTKPSICETGFRTYLLTEMSITLEEDAHFVSHSTTGLKTWEAAQYLSEWCLENPGVFENRRVLELGSGVGLLGLTVLGACGPAFFVFTDKSHEVLSILSRNLALNDATSTTTERLVWADAKQEDAERLRPDVLLGADVMYDPSMADSLCHALRVFLSNSATCAYLAAAVRDKATHDAFLARFDAAGLRYQVETSPQKNVFIYDKSLCVLYKILVA